jgi:hypothetical protein
MADGASGLSEVDPWAAVLGDFRVAATDRLGGRPGKDNYPEVAEILDATKPTVAGLQSATDRVRALKAPDDVGDDVVIEYATLVSSLAGEWQQLLDRAVAEPSVGGTADDLSRETALRHGSNQPKSRAARKGAVAQPESHISGPNHPAYVVALVVAPLTVAVAQMFGVFGWLVLGYAIYLATVVVLTRFLRHAPMTELWKNVLGYASPLLVVAVAAVIFRNAIHPAFAWSNALLFFAR